MGQRSSSRDYSSIAIQDTGIPTSSKTGIALQEVLGSRGESGYFIAIDQRE